MSRAVLVAESAAIAVLFIIIVALWAGSRPAPAAIPADASAALSSGNLQARTSNTPTGYPEPEPAVAASPSRAASADSTVSLARPAAPMPAPNRGWLAPAVIGGRATWYGADGMIAAAGPALRDFLGRGWRGTLVSLCGGPDGRCIVVRISDWCLCTGGGGRLIDLSDDAFAQLAPLSQGVIRVTITRAVRNIPEPPATDTE